MAFSSKVEEEIKRFSEMPRSCELVPVEEIIELPRHFEENLASFRRRPQIPKSTELRPDCGRVFGNFTDDEDGD